MKKTRALSLLLASLAAAPPLAGQSGPDEVAFAESADFDFGGPASPDLVVHPFTAEEKARLRALLAVTVAEARDLLPGLPAALRIVVARVDRDLSGVGGVTGRAEAPGEILIELSVTFDGGLPAQAPGLRHTLFHELHHLVRGWTMRENRFGPGIAIAAVNEGLAEVFAEGRTGLVLPANEYPDEAREWAEEILALPPDADYGAWMFEHPDGRRAVGYRTGRFIVHRAMANSGMTVLELTDRSPEEILELSGVTGTGR